MADVISAWNFSQKSSSWIQDLQSKSTRWQFSSVSGIVQIVDHEVESILASALWSIPRPDTSPSYFKAGMLYAVPLLCSKKECVLSPFCVNETGGLYPKKTLASLVSVKSYMMFNLIGVEDLSWLIAPVTL